MVFIPLTTEQVNADSPLDETVMVTIKDNEIDLNARTTVLETALITDVSTGLYAGASSPLITIQASSVSTAYEIAKEIKLTRGGNLKIKYTLSTGSTFITPTYRTNIFRNGTAVGTETTGTLGVGVVIDYEQDVAGWVKGDLLQVQIQSVVVNRQGAIGKLLVASSEAHYLGGENINYRGT